MASLDIYAALSAGAYNDARSFTNRNPLPTNWSQIAFGDGLGAGLTIGAFSDGAEIVIAIKGTDPSLADIIADAGLGTGLGSQQVALAALFYARVKQFFPGMPITFTGHSLGAGVASILSVWFNERATVFADAPFKLSAINGNLIESTAQLLADNGHTALAQALGSLVTVTTVDHVTTRAVKTDVIRARAANITALYVQGEVLNALFHGFNTLVGPNIPLVIGGGDAVDMITLHSINLHAALVMDDQFRLDTIALPTLLPIVMDETLYARKLESNDPDFLTRLVNSHIPLIENGDTSLSLLSRFSRDMERISDPQGTTSFQDVRRGLILAGVEYYNFVNTPGEDFFKKVAGGIQFDFARINQPVDDQKGYAHLKQYVEGNYSGLTGYFATAGDPGPWSVQTGTDGLAVVGDASRGDVMLGGDIAANYLDGAAGNDLLIGGAAADFLQGGVGDDILWGGFSTDTYSFRSGDGNDRIIDDGGAGVLIRDEEPITLGVGADGATWVSISNDVTFTRTGASLTINFQGSPDVITIDNFDFEKAKSGGGYLGVRLVEAPTVAEGGDPDMQGDREIKEFIDTLAVNDTGGVTFPPEWRNPLLISTTGDLATYRHNLADDLGNLIRTGEPSPDLDDFFFDSAGDDLIVTEGGKDEVDAKRGGDDIIRTGAGRDVVKDTGGGDDTIEGGANGDVVFSGDGEDLVYAETAPEDFATGFAAATDPNALGSGQKGDFLSAGSGDDFVFGGADNDVLIGGAGNDVLVGGAGDDTILDGDSTRANSLDWGLSRFSEQSGDVTTFTIQWLGDVTQVAIDSPDADALYGGAGNDWLWGGGGDDLLDGGSGNDIFLGQDGSDILIGGIGDDRLFGDDFGGAAPGDDYLDGGAGNDEVNGNDGNDFLSGGDDNDTLRGGNGGDWLYGGPGEDLLIGGPGKDTYVFNVGDGLETIFDTPAGPDDPEASVLQLGPGISAEDIRFLPGSLVIAVSNTDQIHFLQMDLDDPQSTQVLDYILFADGSLMTYQDILDRGFDIDGTEDADLLYGTGVMDRIDGKGGDDVVFGRSDDDFILGGAGDDQLVGDLGNDSIDGGDGDDQLDGGAGRDILTGGAGDDTMAGGLDDDTLSGAVGNDLLTGDTGADVYLFASGDGSDTIDEQGLVASNVLDTGTDVIGFSEGIFAPDVSLVRQANGDLLVRYGTGDEIRVLGQYTPGGNAIERIEFADGSFIDKAAIDAVPVGVVQGTEGDDVLIGTDSPETILGLGGSDFIDGRAGNDRLEGGAGADTYFLDRGMGRDLISDSSPTAGEIGTLKLGAGFTFDHIKAQRQGEDLFVNFRGLQEGAVVQGYYAPAAATQQWQVMLADGTVMPIEELIARPDPNAGVIPLSAMEDYKQSILSAWAADSRPLIMPTHALVFSQVIQTTIDTQINGTPRHIGPDIVSTNTVEEYGRPTAGGFVVVGPSDRTVVSNVVTVNSDASQITASATPTATTSFENHNVFLQRKPLMPYRTVSQSLNGVTVTTQVISSGEGWVPIILDANINVADVLQVSHNVEQRYIEEIHGGPGANLIVGAANPFSFGALAHVALIDAGGGDDTIFAGPADFVYGNDGDDSIFAGKVAYGGNGNDSITGTDTQFGGTGSDRLEGGAFMDGGAGSDLLIGKDGATLFFVGSTEAAGDLVEDMGTVDFASAYWRSVGIEDPDESNVYGGSWVIPQDSPTFNAMVRNGFTFGSLSFDTDEFRRNSDFASPLYHSIDDVLAELNNLRVPLRAEDIIFIRPLPPVPVVAANDYAALQPFYDSGALEMDTVQFGPGVSFEDLTLRFGAGEMLDISWGTDQSLSVQLATASDPIGTGIERFIIGDAQYSLYSLVQIARQNVAPATAGNDVIVFTDLADVGFGLDGNDELYGLSGNDVLDGGAADDYLEGDSGNDILIGGAGIDDLSDSRGNNYLDGGAGADHFLADGRPSFVDGGANFVVGGADADRVDSYADGNVIAFNAGDGNDTVYARERLVLSMGGGIQANELSLRQQGGDLVLSAGGTDSIRLTRSLEADPQDWPQIKLQIIAAGSVSTYDLNAVIDEFRAEAAQDPTLQLPIGALLQASQLSSSTTEALGGALAYQYAVTGNTDAVYCAEADRAVGPRVRPAASTDQRQADVERLGGQ
jgi:Ca2+-binding RTX toxin-like protein